MNRPQAVCALAALLLIAVAVPMARAFNATDIVQVSLWSTATCTGRAMAIFNVDLCCPCISWVYDGVPSSANRFRLSGPQNNTLAYTAVRSVGAGSCWWP